MAPRLRAAQIGGTRRLLGGEYTHLTLTALAERAVPALASNIGPASTELEQLSKRVRSGRRPSADTRQGAPAAPGR